MGPSSSVVPNDEATTLEVGVTGAHPGGVKDDAPASRLLERLFEGPPPVLPAALDRIAEDWARVRPRARLALSLCATLALLAAAGRGAVRSPWGEPVAVLVARVDLPAGHVLAASDLATARWPARLVPADVPDDPAEHEGVSLAIGLPAGALLLPAHLAAGGVAAGLSADQVAVAVGLSDGVAVTAGQHVDLLAVDSLGGGVRLAANTAVLSVDGARVWVAVTRDEAPAVTAAAMTGDLSVAALPPGAHTPTRRQVTSPG